MDNLEIATSRTWAEINLDELVHNVKILRECLSDNAKFLGVCKANAYGHGMVEIAKKLQSCELVDWIAVATIPEAVELRKNNISLPILCLGQTQPKFAELISDYNISQGTAANFQEFCN